MMRKIAFIVGLMSSGALVAQWQELPVPTIIKGFSIKSLAIGNQHVIWALGIKNQQESALFSWHEASSSWQEISKKLPYIEAIAANNNNILFALQKTNGAASLQAWNGSSWQEMYRIEHARIGSLAALGQNKVCAVINEKAYMLNGESWHQLGTIEGFREVAAGGENTLFARRFNFEAALNPTTAVPAHSLELLRWDMVTKTWQKQNVVSEEKEKGIMSIAVQGDTALWLIIREGAMGGKVYSWNHESQKLEQRGANSDLYLVAASNDGTVWALSGSPGQPGRKLYRWVEEKSVPAQKGQES